MKDIKDRMNEHRQADQKEAMTDKKPATETAKV
jgi:hypothetical protein